MSAPVVFSYLNAMNERKASDLYLTVGYPPTLRVEDELIHIVDKQLSPDDINEILNSMLTSRQKRDFEAQMELNTALDMGPHGRFRVNVLRQRQFPALVIRRIISQIPTFADLRLPKILEALSMEKRGLVLLTGMTGSGKSTTLAAMVDYRNSLREGHIITIEDPIEYFHEHKRSVVTQREVGVDTESYSTALKNALRQRPDSASAALQHRDASIEEPRPPHRGLDARARAGGDGRHGQAAEIAALAQQARRILHRPR